MPDFIPGLEGVVAFETEIAEPDKEGGSLRYRGVDIEELVGHVTYGHVWGLLVDTSFAPGLPPAEPFPIPVHSGDIRVDVQSALAMLAPAYGMRQLMDIDRKSTRLNSSGAPPPPGLPPAEPFPIPVHSGDIRVDVQSALAMLAPAYGMRQLMD